MKNVITDHFDEHLAVIKNLSEDHINVIVDIAQSIVSCYKNGGKLLLFGNGGSAQDAEHIAAELVGRYAIERKSLPAIALNINTSVLTAIANDYGYHQVFERQVDALVNKGDVVIGLSTSGNAENVIRGVLKAKEKGAKTVGFTGKGGGKLKDVIDMHFEVPSSNTPRIQEVHITVGHIICGLVEEALFGK